MVLFFQGYFVPLRVDADKGNPDGKNKIILLQIVAAVYMHQVLYRSNSFPGFFNDEFENSTLTDTFFELDPVHADGDEVAAGIFHGGGDIGKFVHPFEQVPAKKKTIVVQVFWQDQSVIFHRLFPL